MATLLAEQHWEERESFAALVQDISKAFDSVSRFMGKEMSLRRLGMPEGLIGLFLAMDIGNRAEIVTAYGRSSDILGSEAGTFEFLRGYCQGSCFSTDCQNLSIRKILLAVGEKYCSNGRGFYGGTGAYSRFRKGRKSNEG